MSRISAVTFNKASWLQKVAYRYAVKRFGAVPEPFAVAARHPRLLWANVVHELMVEKGATTLPVSVRELAVYRTAVVLGCSWCIDFGAMLQKHSGLDVDRLRRIDDYATSPLFTTQERLAIAYADAMTSTPTSVTDEQIAELRREFGDKGLLELTYLISLENMRGRSNSALGITDQVSPPGKPARCPCRPRAKASPDSSCRGLSGVGPA